MLTQNLQKARYVKELVVFLILLITLTTLHFLWFFFNFHSWENVPPYTTLIHMLIPASSAIFCMIIFKDKGLTAKAKWIFGFFGLYAFVFLVESFYQPLIPGHLIALPPVQAVPIVSTLVAILGFITIIVFNVKKNWRENLALAKLWFGKHHTFFLWFSIVFAALTIFLFYLNHLFNFGPALLEYSIGKFAYTWPLMIVLSIFILWPQYFGEEFGWRVYLQDRLLSLFGPWTGIILIGFIWGIWHAGNIVMGMNWPGQPFSGNLQMILITIILAFIYGYAVIRTKSVWIAVLLHLILDTTEVAAILYLSQAKSTLSFGGGLYSFIFFGIFALAIIILGKKTWQSVTQV